MIKQTCLYKLDSTGKVREWACWTEGNIIILRYGPINSPKSLVFDKIICESEQDADIQAQRRIDKQRDRRGYTEHIPTKKELRPMLCQRAQEHMDKIPENVVFQPKLDGYRCLGSKTSLITRTNAPLPAFPHIKYALQFLPDDVIIDGELYCHGSRFQSIMKSRSQLATSDSIMIEFHAFDVVDENVTFTNRRITLASTILDAMADYEKQPFVTSGGSVIPFPIIPVQTSAGKLHELPHYQASYKAKGYEGTIIRIPDAKYEIDVRSYGIYKYKEVDQDWYAITSVEPGPKDRNMGVLVCQNSKGLLFRVNLKGTDNQKKNLLRYPHTVIGKRCLVQYFGMTDNNLPRNAVAVEIL